VVIDSSALIAIVFDEPDAPLYIAAILSDSKRLMSAATLVEASIVILNRRKPTPIAALDALLARLQILVLSVDENQALLARAGFQRSERAGTTQG
jgi:ribonuclease VapC